MTPRVRTVLVLLAFAAIYFVWGSTYFAIRVGLEAFPPFLMAGARFLVAGIPLHLWTRRSGKSTPTLLDWSRATGLGVLLLVGGNGLVTWAEQRVPSGLAALMVTTVPIWMVLLEWLAFGGARPRRLTAFGLTLGPIGIALLVGSGGAGGSGPAGGAIPPLGALALLLSSASWAAGSLLSRRWRSSSSSLQKVSMEMIGGGAALFLIGTFAGEWARFDPAAVSVRPLAAFGYLTLFGSLVALSAYDWLLRTVPPDALATYAFVNPVVAVLVGWALGGETLGPRTLAAAALILGAVAVLHTSARRRALVAVPRSSVPGEKTGSGLPMEEAA